MTFPQCQEGKLPEEMTGVGLLFFWNSFWWDGLLSVHDGLMHSIFNSLLLAGLRCLWIVHSNLKNSLQFRVLPWPNFQSRVWPLLLLSEVCFGFACDLRVTCTDASNQFKGIIKGHLAQVGNWERKSATCVKAGLGYITKLRLKAQI